jgi:hypothetical protein
MTNQESLKRRIRERMAKTGERYAAARRVLIEKAAARPRTWASEPDLSNESIRRGTGRDWDEWCEIIDGWPGHDDGHPSIATFVRDENGVDAWWAQAVTVGYERITGRRLPYEQPDGTFTASRSRTISLDPGVLREMLLAEAGRGDLFPGHQTELRSRRTAKAIRLAIGPGMAVISLASATGVRTKVSVAHEMLPSVDAVEEWKFYWAEWLEAIDPTAA